jgi:AraC-like DNA-binding protein
MIADGMHGIRQQPSAGSKTGNMAKIKKALTQCGIGLSSRLTKKQPDSSADENDFHDFDEFRELLPSDENKFLILEDKFLLRDASMIIKMQRELLRTYSGEQRRRTPKEPKPNKVPPELTKSIEPEELKERLLKMFEDDEMYLDEDITLASLAHLLEIEPYQLTLFLNRCMNTNFHGFINTYRIEAAKKLLVDEPNENILEVAFCAGFNSKASFNRIFKRITGLTPSQYRKTSTESTAVS